MEGPASHFSNRVGRRSVVAPALKITVTDERPNPSPCVFGAGEAEVLGSGVVHDERDIGFGSVYATSLDDCVAVSHEQCFLAIDTRISWNEARKRSHWSY
jgi:hypothetical protein